MKFLLFVFRSHAFSTCFFKISGPLASHYTQVPSPPNCRPLEVGTQKDASAAIGRRVQGDRSGRSSLEPARCAAGPTTGGKDLQQASPTPAPTGLKRQRPAASCATGKWAGTKCPLPTGRPARRAWPGTRRCCVPCLIASKVGAPEGVKPVQWRLLSSPLASTAGAGQRAASWLTGTARAGRLSCSS